MDDSHLSGYRFLHFDEIDSTNNYLKRLGCDTDGELCVFADSQSGGRGRRGRSFVSREGGLYLSFTTAAGDDALSVCVTPRAAVAVCRAVEAMCGISVQIKWVNDIFCNEKKLCGILCEAIADTDGHIRRIVVGIGINLAGEPAPELRGIATSVGAEGGNIPDRRALCERILSEYLSAGDFREEYASRQLALGRRVKVIGSDGTYEAVAEGLDDKCALVVRDDIGHKHTLNSGEVSLRL